jgi:hypothetical protein
LLILPPLPLIFAAADAAIAIICQFSAAEGAYAPPASDVAMPPF